MATLIRGSSPKAVIFTCKNTSLKDWKEKTLTAFKERNHEPGEIEHLVYKHSWEEGETPMAFVERVMFRRSRTQQRDKVLECLTEFENNG